VVKANLSGFCGGLPEWKRSSPRALFPGPGRNCTPRHRMLFNGGQGGSLVPVFTRACVSFSHTEEARVPNALDGLAGNICPAQPPASGTAAA